MTKPDAVFCTRNTETGERGKRDSRALKFQMQLSSFNTMPVRFCGKNTREQTPPPPKKNKKRGRARRFGEYLRRCFVGLSGDKGFSVDYSPRLLKVHQRGHSFIASFPGFWSTFAVTVDSHLDVEIGVPNLISEDIEPEFYIKIVAGIGSRDRLG